VRKPIKRKATFGSQISDVYRQPAPTKGWIASENIVGMPPDSAFLLDNWFPETNSIKLRAGYDVHSLVLGGSPVDTIMVYQAGTNVSIFAAVGSSIYDVTATVADPWDFVYWAEGLPWFGSTSTPTPWVTFFWGGSFVSFNPPT
jgi:hypothetical protein